jgi:cytochrome c oxidase assembly factor CtaG
MSAWDSYPFSAHIVQHFLLALVFPPLLLLGIPSFDLRGFRRMERLIGQPPVSWLLGVGAMLAWHVPAFFNAALANNGLHIFQQLSFVISGAIFWWPILGPLRDRHLPALAAVAYLFSACVCCSLLGAFLTFGPSGLYAAYLHPHHPSHGAIDPKSDQQLGGLLMWVPGCFVYLAGILSTVLRWYDRHEIERHAH